METIQSIIQWHQETFGDKQTCRGQEKKFQDELREFERETDRTKKVIELADVFIVSCGIARFSTTTALACFSKVFELCEKNFSSVELFEAINTKMRVNRNREWNISNGSAQHKE